MNIPNLITREVLSAMAAPDETHAVRVVLSKVTSSVPYKLRSKLRSYVFEKDREIGAHVLDVPVSVWMAGADDRARRGEGAICKDLQPSMNFPLTVLVIPWRNASAADTAVTNEALAVLRELLAILNPPPVVFEALDLAQTGDVAKLRYLLDRGKQKAADGEETPAQARARKMREAKAAKRREQLQPA